MKKLLHALSVILGFLLLFSYPGSTQAQLNWEKYADNPVIQGAAWVTRAGRPIVIYEDQLFKMWFYGSYNTGYTESQDGITWSDPVMVIPPGNPGEWDYDKLPFSIIRVNDTLKMWYFGNDGTSGWIYDIGYAYYSEVSVEWVFYPDPVLEKGGPGSWDESTVLHPTVLYDGTTYHMWYSGQSGGSIDDTVYIGYATSLDGIDWTKDTINNPVLSPGPDSSFYDLFITPTSVIQFGDIFYLYFTGWDGTSTDPFNFKIGCATSTDGVEWAVQNDDLPILDVGGNGGWDDDFVRYCSVIFHENRFKMWYDGVTGSLANLKIGYALGDTLINPGIIEKGTVSISTVYPNPASGVLNFRFQVSVSGNVQLKIYDLHGREVATVLDEWMPAGEHVVSFDAGSLPAGVYFYRESSVGSRRSAVGKLIVIR